MESTFEYSLGQFAEEIDNNMGNPKKIPEGSACSVFLYDYKRDAYVLRASTKGSTHLGIAQLDTSQENYNKWKKNDLYRIGLTQIAIYSGDDIVAGELTNIKETSCAEMEDDELLIWERSNYCEFARDNISSIMIIPFTINSMIMPDQKEWPNGIVRLVRSNKISLKFNNHDKQKLREYIDDKLNSIKSNFFLSQLIELGTYTDIHVLCNQAALILRDLFKGKGCSIFLVDEKNSTSNKRLYRCFGTTGLASRNHTPLTDPYNNRKAWYEFNPDMEPSALSLPEIPLTVGVIRARLGAFIENINKENEIKKQFPAEYKIKRKRGPGKISEFLTDENGTYLKAGSIIYAPMFYTSCIDKSIDVLGVVRIVRPDLSPAFSLKEQHLFMSMVQRLSEAVKSAKIMQFLGNLNDIVRYEDLFKEVMENIPKFIGANDCALLIKKGYKLFRMAEWREGKANIIGEKNDKNPYDLRGSNYGYSGYVSITGKKLRFNNPEELPESFGDDEPPKHREATSEETSAITPHRYFGLPIKGLTDKNRVLGVIRVCKTKESTCFTNNDDRIFEMIAKRLSRRIEQYHHDDQAREAIQEYFPLILQASISDLSINTKCKDILVDFFDRITSNVSIEEAVVDLLQELWKRYELDYNFNSTIFRNFEMFNTDILSEIPHYRDHFIHQIVVFIIGIIIMDNLHNNINDAFESAYHIPSLDVEVAWFYTAIFHDIAYPLESINQWIENIIKKFLSSSHHGIRSSLPLEDILFDSEYLNSIDRIRKFHKDLLKRNDLKIRDTMIRVLRGQDEKNTGLDHGIMGALLLLGENRFDPNDILPSASAIALHNKLKSQDQIEKISFDNHPLAFLLIYCDILHEWGRDILKGFQKGKNRPDLVKLFVKNKKEINENRNDYDSNFLKIIDSEKYKEDKIFVFAKIRYENDSSYKMKEINNTFPKLISHKIHFSIKVDGRLFEI